MLVFFGMLVVGLFYVYFLVPETKGITLEEVTIFFFPSSTFFIAFHAIPNVGRRAVPVWYSGLAFGGMGTMREALSSRRPSSGREARLGIRGRSLKACADRGRNPRDKLA